MQISVTDVTNTFTYLEYNQMESENPYSSSPMKLFQDMSSKKKSAAFEKIFAEVLTESGYIVQRSKNSDFDRFVNNKRVEIKGSMGWVSDGIITHYRFQQIRPHQDYDYVAFMFFTPDKLIIKFSDKETVIKNLVYQDNDGNWPHNQHGGKTKNSGTFFIDTLPNTLTWMKNLDQITF
jgi:hypothetical protein